MFFIDFYWLKKEARRAHPLRAKNPGCCFLGFGWNLRSFPAVVGRNVLGLLGLCLGLGINVGQGLGHRMGPLGCLTGWLPVPLKIGLDVQGQ